MCKMLPLTLWVCFTKYMIYFLIMGGGIIIRLPTYHDKKRCILLLERLINRYLLYYSYRDSLYFIISMKNMLAYS